MSDEPKSVLFCLSCDEEHANPYHCPNRHTPREAIDAQLRRPARRVEKLLPFGDSAIIRAGMTGPIRMPHHDQAYRPVTLLMRKEDREAFDLCALHVGRDNLFKDKVPLWLGATDRLDWMPTIVVAIEHRWIVTNITETPRQFRGALLIAVVER